jgi:hypothetical protein
MIYDFSFRITTGYKYAFNTLFKGIYPFCFYGYSIYEIYKYVAKSVAGVVEVTPPSLEYADLKVSFDSIYKNILQAVEDSGSKTIGYYKSEQGVDTLAGSNKQNALSQLDSLYCKKDIDINRHKDLIEDKDIGINRHKDISDNKDYSVHNERVYYITKDLITSIDTKHRIALSMIVSDVVSNSLGLAEASSMIYALSDKQVTMDTIDMLLKTLSKDVLRHGSVIYKYKNRSVYRNNIVGIANYRGKNINIQRPVRVPYRKGLAILKVTSRYINTQLERPPVESSVNKLQTREIPNITNILRYYRRILSSSKVRDIYNQDFMKQLLLAPGDGTTKRSSNNNADSISVEAYLKHLMEVLVDSTYDQYKPEEAYVEETSYREVSTTERSGAEKIGVGGYKNQLKETIPQVSISANRHKIVNTISPTRKHNRKSTYTMVRVRKHKRNYVSTVTGLNKNKYKDLRFYKRWRYKTGEAHDKIWINPQKQDFLRYRENEVTVEAVISFKAMLDFILFVEQILYVNKNHFSACIPTHAVNRFISILDEWITEAQPENEVSDEYSYLVRWCIWMAEGKLSKYSDNLSLIGYQVLEEIRDDMVRYFESRWGKRVVEYGPDGMFTYSKDHSYINRLRGKKHGNNKRTWNGDMKREYGISEGELSWDVEEERKI